MTAAYLLQYCMDQKNFIDLRDLLAFLYPDVLSIRRIIDDAGIDSSRIDISEKAVNSWHFVLTEGTCPT